MAHKKKKKKSDDEGDGAVVRALKGFARAHGEDVPNKVAKKEKPTPKKKAPAKTDFSGANKAVQVAKMKAAQKAENARSKKTVVSRPKPKPKPVAGPERPRDKLLRKTRARAKTNFVTPAQAKKKRAFGLRRKKKK
jgi:hypothetical protein